MVSPFTLYCCRGVLLFFLLGEEQSPPLSEASGEARKRANIILTRVSDQEKNRRQPEQLSASSHTASSYYVT